MSESHLILASGSPRRRELLTLMGIEFTVCPVDVDEHLRGHPVDVVMALAEKKAEAAAGLASETEETEEIGDAPEGEGTEYAAELSEIADDNFETFAPVDISELGS